jgi:hypothetical protein
MPLISCFVESTDGMPHYNHFWPWLRAQGAAHDVFLEAWNSLSQPELTFFEVLNSELSGWDREQKYK